MRRTQISLTDEDRRLLDAESARTGLSMSALIRAAIARTYGRQGDVSARLHAIDAASGSWQEREFDGGAYVEALRSGRRLGGAQAQ